MRQHHHLGFGLVELMIALTLGLLISTALIQVLLGVSRGARSQYALAGVQEGARFAMAFLGREIRMAGYLGCANLTTAGPAVLAQPTLDFSLETALVGFNNLAEDNDWAAKPGSDAVWVRRAGDVAISLPDSISVSGGIPIEDNYPDFEQGDYLLLSDCSHADLIRLSNQPKGAGEGASTLFHEAGEYNSSANLSSAYPEDSRVRGYLETVFFVRDTGRRSDDNIPIYALFVQQLRPGSGGEWLAAMELVAGVENLQFQFGADTDGDGAVDDYWDADAIADWQQVLSVSMALTLTAEPANVVGREGSVLAQQLEDEKGEVVANQDGHLRRVLSNVFAIRNRLP